MVVVGPAASALPLPFALADQRAASLPRTAVRCWPGTDVGATPGPGVRGSGTAAGRGRPCSGTLK